MADKGIIFSASMVRALLSGSKTQTRRLLRNPEYFGCPTGDCPHETQAQCNEAMAGLSAKEANGYAAGDRLYVREQCRAEELSRPDQIRPATRKERQLLGRTSVIVSDELDGMDGVRYIADNEWRQIENTSAAGEAWLELFHYRGRGKDRIGNSVPSIHMPRWASRLWLSVTEVRVQRLQDIRENDCYCEGLDRPLGPRLGSDVTARDNAQRWYRDLWHSLHTKTGERWEDNPWIVAVSFDVHKGNIDAGRGA